MTAGWGCRLAVDHAQSASQWVVRRVMTHNERIVNWTVMGLAAAALFFGLFLAISHHLA